MSRTTSESGSLAASAGAGRTGGGYSGGGGGGGGLRGLFSRGNHKKTSSGKLAAEVSSVQPPSPTSAAAVLLADDGALRGGADRRPFIVDDDGDDDAAFEEAGFDHSVSGDLSPADAERVPVAGAVATQSKSLTQRLFQKVTAIGSSPSPSAMPATPSPLSTASNGTSDATLLAAAAKPAPMLRGESTVSTASAGSAGRSAVTNRCPHGFFLQETTIDGELLQAGVAMQTAPVRDKAPSGQFEFVEITLVEGRNLIACDRSGTSDPYVVFHIGDGVFRSRVEKKSLAPVWNEFSSLPIAGEHQTLQIAVFDWNKVERHTPMGSASVALSTLWDGASHDLWLQLDGVASGEIHVSLQLVERAGVAVTDLLPGKAARKRQSGTGVLGDTSGRTTALQRKKKAPTSGTLSVVLVEGIDLAIRDEDTASSDPYVRFTLGKQKRRSSVVNQDLNPVWREMFEFQITSRSEKLLMEVFDQDMIGSDDFMGRVTLDLAELSDNRTSELVLDLEDVERGQIRVSATLTWLGEPDDGMDVLQQYALLREDVHQFSKKNLVGVCMLKVVSAEGLRAADIRGTSDPYVVIEHGNLRLRTETMHRTLAPVWNRSFCIPLTDLSVPLELTVLDEDKDGSSDFLGKVVLPLWDVRPGPQRIVLKKRDLVRPAKGTIRVEMSLEYDAVRS
jgi:hypothetical protein